MNKRRHFLGKPPQKAAGMQDTVNETDLRFLELIKDLKYSQAFALAGQVQNINIRDANSQATFLHYSASNTAVNFLRDVIELRTDIDFLALDGKGRRASEIAWHYAHDEELGALLMQHEKEQAAREGKPAWPPEPQ